MIRVGLTGGIGSGKSTVAAFFEDLGIPVYVADLQAKYLMENDAQLRDQITALLGASAYKDGQLNRGYVAEQVFGNAELLQDLNSLVHPAVRRDFQRWASLQKAPYVVQEAAILFENGGYQNFDKMILVTAPEGERLRRVMARDKASEADVRARMDHQWPDDRKRPLADFEIRNDTLPHVLQQVEEVHGELLELSGSMGVS